MVSENKTVMRCISILIDKREKLRDKKQHLRDRIDQRYPVEEYGIMNEMKFDEAVKKTDDEIQLLSTYISGMYDLIEIIEGREKIKGAFPQ